MAKFNQINGLDNPVPLFPLPNVVLFPGVDLSLHIFEPRYRDMCHEVLKNSQLLAMANFKPNWEKDYYKNPEIHETVCVGKVVLSEERENGKYNITLLGITRATVLSENRTRPYRVATIKPIRDEIPPDNLKETYDKCIQVIDLVRKWGSNSQLLEMGLPNVQRDDPESIIIASYRIASAIKSNAEIMLFLREAESVLQRFEYSHKLLSRDLGAAAFHQTNSSFMGQSLN